MLVLIWVTVLLSVSDGSAEKDASMERRPACDNEFCITLNEGEIAAEAGLCVVIPCSFTNRSGSPFAYLVWMKCEASKLLSFCGDSDVIFNFNKDNKNVQSGFKGRVSLLDPNMWWRNCSIIINDLTESDSGSYQFRVNRQHQKPDKFTFSPKATVSVKDLTQKPTVMIPPLTEGQQCTLTCTAPGLCSGSDPQITWTWRGAGEKDSHITGNITEFRSGNLTAAQRHSSTLTFNPSAEHHGTKVTCKVSFKNNIVTEETVTLNVAYVKELKISGSSTVKEGDALSLTCTVDSFPASLITWSKFCSNKNLQNETTIILQNDMRTAALVIPNMTTEHCGQYVCTAQHLNTTLTTQAEVTVTFFPKILKNSGCVVQSEVLTCVCISEGVPLPTIRLSLFQTHTEYSVITSVSNHTVNTVVTVSVKDRDYSTVWCVGHNVMGEAKENLTVKINELTQEDLLKKLFIIVQQTEVIIAFSIGFLLSASVWPAICCLARKYLRNKQRSSGNMIESLEKMHAGQSLEYDGTLGQEPAEEGAEAAGQSVLDGDVEPEEVDYSDVDFSWCKRRSTAGAEAVQETTETEYTEIKNGQTEERRDSDGEDIEMWEGNEEEAVMMEDDEETTQCMSDQKGEDWADVAVYSNLNEIVDLI